MLGWAFLTSIRNNNALEAPTAECERMPSQFDEDGSTGTAALAVPQSRITEPPLKKRCRGFC